MVEFEKILLNQPADLVVIFGAVNTTTACAIASAKLLALAIHVKAGLRSFD